MPQLDNYLVTLGMKGQNIVLSQMDKIRKKGAELSKKKTVVDLMSKVAKAGLGGLAGIGALKNIAKGAANLPFEKKQTDEEKKQQKEKEASNKHFSQTAQKFGNGVKDFASAASTLDPTTTISSITSALGTSLSGISVLGVSLGRLPEGIAAISNSMLSMAKNSVDMAKQATAAYHQLATRNAAAENYGKNITDKGPLSRNERAMFIDMVSGSMGKIQAPLADEINKLIGKKDTRALARVGAGDWESTGTDKGWMLGQISSSFQGLPPSIKQKLQASLLKQNAGEIQNMAPGQENVQRRAAWFANTEEDQTKRVYDKSVETSAGITGMITNMNSLQLTLYSTGLKFAGTINDMSKAMQGLPQTINELKSSVKKFVDDPSVRNARGLINSIKVGNGN